MRKYISALLSLLVCLTASAVTVQLPATLNKANVNAVSSGMTYYNNDYFQLHKKSGKPNPWAEWSVELATPGRFAVTESGYYTNGHQYLYELRNGSTVVTSLTTTKTYEEGELSFSTLWDLSNVAAGTYTLRVQCALDNGHPSLKSLQFEFLGDIIPEPAPLPAPDPAGAQVSYTADNTTIFPNPERGFITMLEGKKSRNYAAVKGKESYLTNHANNDKGSLILVLYYLEDLNTTATLPQSVLTAFDEDMAVLRNYGMKAIVRFAYTNQTYKIPNPDPTKDSLRTAADASLEIIEQHIAQLKSHWLANTDVIFVFQAGFIGAYGEWHYTDNFGNTESHINDARRAFLDTLLRATPQDRCVQVRTPLYKSEYIGSNTAIQYSEAYTSTNKARLGHHNDAFLYGANNMGTYKDTALQKPYVAQDTYYVPIGGESDITDDDQAAVEAAHDVTIAEMSRLHWTFIQSGYSTHVTDMWRQNGTFDELNIKLGYRYQLLNGTYTQSAAPGGNLSVYMNIRNMGFAPLYNERPVYIVLRSNANTYRLRMSADPRRWRPNGVTTTVSEVLTLPDNIVPGTYQLYLHMPDAYASIANDPRYAVRFANTGVWDAETGMNALNATLTIEGEAPEPEPSYVQLPATLNKANVAAVSNDMEWYGDDLDYFDYGSEDKSNTGRWADWTVKLTYPGKYIVTEEFDVPGTSGHEWQLKLLNNVQDSVAGYHTTRVWKAGNVRQESTKWDLSSLSAGIYTLRVTNAFPYARPKLKRITLDYDGVIPTAIEQVSVEGPGICGPADMRVYDLCGREVTASKDHLGRGIFIVVTGSQAGKVMIP